MSTALAAPDIESSTVRGSSSPVSGTVGGEGDSCSGRSVTQRTPCGPAGSRVMIRATGRVPPGAVRNA